MEDKGYFIHPTAVMDPGAQVGIGTKIWHFSHLMPSSQVGKHCVIGQNVYVDSNVIIGNGVKIQNNVSIYNGVEVEDDVFLGPSMVFTNVINPRSFIERKNEFQKTIIRKGASIGANATIICGIEIGRYAMIGAGAIVLQTIPPYALVVGNPGHQVGWVSEAGHTLNFDIMGFATCPQSGDKYRLTNNILQKL